MEPRVFSATDFELLNVERTGGMSRVCKARLVLTGEICALKFAKGSSEPEEASESFNREAAALLDMDHKNVIKLLGIGTDGTERFLALEWLEETLAERIQSFGPISWQSFYELLGRPLLDALRYSHSRGYAHRDLKPLNIMLGKLGDPKITDFGIARNRESVRLGITFAKAGSPPWTPPEVDDTANSECRDLYSWAAVCVANVTGNLDFKSVAELRNAVCNVGVGLPGEVLLRCLADDPTKRPTSAIAMLWELDEFHRKRFEDAEAKRWIGIDISPYAHQKLEDLAGADLPVSDRVASLLSDFAEPCQIFSLPDGDLEFTGNMYCLKGGRASPDSPWLIVKDLRPAVQRHAAVQGIKAVISLVERSGSSIEPGLSRGNLSFVESFLASVVERDLFEQKRRDDERYLTMLQDVLAARTRTLRELPALKYFEGRWEGGEFSVGVDSEEMPAPGEQRVVRGTNGILVFGVARVAHGRVFLLPIGPRRGQPHPDGLLQVDTNAQRRSIERQEEALKTLCADLAVAPALKNIILHPELADRPEISGRPAPEELSPDKAAILDAALGMRELMVVRGPPGTGKTRLITAIISRFLRENPKAKVLVAAQTHIAIDHVIEKLIADDTHVGRIVRIARTDEDKVAVNVRPVLLQNCLLEWCQTTAARSRGFMRQFCQDLGFDAGEVELSIRVEALLLACERLQKINDALAKGQQELSTAQTKAATVPLLDAQDIEIATAATLTVGELQQQVRQVEELAIKLRDELKNLSSDGAMLADLPEHELVDWTSILGRTEPQWISLRKQLELQISWIDLLGQLRQFEEIVLRSSSVVGGTCVGLASNDAFSKINFDLCVIDEASKASAPEALVPMVRSARCLIVGDPAQLPPFGQDLTVEGYSDLEVRETLLDYLIPKLPTECVYELTHQHRMCAGIGELISDVFYEKKLVNMRPNSDRAHWLRKRFAKPVVWIDTMGSKDSAQGYSFVNRGEQDVVLDLLNQLQHDVGRAKARASVAVIAGYAAQADALDRRIARGSLSALDLEIATVHSFQGRESDVCIFSTTLSNSRNYLGFLRGVELLNVALSRPRDLLVIVGNQRFCYEVPGKNPFPRVIDFIDAHPPTCETRHASQ